MDWHGWLTLGIAAGGLGLGLYNTFWPKRPKYALELERDEYLEFRLINTGRRRLTIGPVMASPGSTDLPDLFEIEPDLSKRFRLLISGDPPQIPEEVMVFAREFPNEAITLAVPHHPEPPGQR